MVCVQFRFNKLYAFYVVLKKDMSTKKMYISMSVWSSLIYIKFIAYFWNLQVLKLRRFVLKSMRLFLKLRRFVLKPRRLFLKLGRFVLKPRRLFLKLRRFALTLRRYRKKVKNTNSLNASLIEQYCTSIVTVIQISIMANKSGFFAS